MEKAAVIYKHDPFIDRLVLCAVAERRLGRLALQPR